MTAFKHEEGAAPAADIAAAAERARDEIVELVRRLVSFRTENPKFLDDPEAQGAATAEEAACQEFVAEELRALGCAVDRWEILPGRTNVVGTLAGSADGRSLILNGHIDVVPAGSVGEWPCNPWAGELTDGRIWGRGSCDMKAGIASGLAALRLLRELGIGLRGAVVFQSVTDEEMGGLGTRAAIERGHTADGAVVLEPSNGTLVAAEGGLEWLRVVVRGVGGHSAVRYRSVHAGGRGTAVSAIEKMVKIVVALQELERNWGNTKVHPLMPAGITTIHPGVILGGSGGGEAGVPTNTTTFGNFPDYCSLGVSVKYLPNERAEDVRREVETFITAVASTDPWLSAHPPELEWRVAGVAFPPAELPLDHPLALALQRAFEDEHGEIRWAGFEAVSDLAWLHAAGIPTVLFGPGSTAQAHTTNEYVEVDDVVAATKVVARTLVNWCGTA